MIAFLCPCDQRAVFVPDDQVGRIHACPWSGKRFTVPKGRSFGDAEWRDCQVPTFQMGYLYARKRLPSERKCRLLACATCRCHWDRLPDPLCRRAVEVAERYADGLADEDERQEAEAAARDVEAEVARMMYNQEEMGWASLAAAAVAASVPLTTRLIQTPAPFFPRRSPAEPRPEDCARLREVVGDPFRPVRIRLDWLEWDGGRVSILARSFYQLRRFDLLPILADALEDAGCTNPDLLGHLRGPGPHVPGCWALDLLLGKE
jgi:hypothetical protein